MWGEVRKIIKEQPVFKETINTGGNKQIIINSWIILVSASK
ncbi:hypothetical protein [Spiroplasma endosymbiont of Apeira syringaria]